MSHTCELCNKSFDRKSNYDRHVSRKTSCINIKLIANKIDNTLLDINEVDINLIDINKVDINKVDINKVDNTLLDINKVDINKADNTLLDINKVNNIKNSKINGYRCNICNNKYLHSSSLNKHKKTHTKNTENTENVVLLDELKQIIINQQEQIAKQQEDLAKQQENIDFTNEKINELEMIVKVKNKSKVKKTINNITINNTINNIQIVKFGREDISLLSNDDIQKILYERGSDPINTSIQVIHYNDRLPQYKNIRYTNIRSNIGEIHDGS